MPISEAELMLEVEALTVRYGKATAVENVTLRVKRGQVVALIGPNGAGKSTTLNTIVGLVRSAAGHITFQGEDISGRAPEQLMRRGISLVPEGRQIFTSLTVKENLRLPLAGQGRVKAAALLDRELVRFPALASRLADPAGGLSGGQQQQLAIARALLSNPTLLLLDEPSLGLAPKIVDVVFDTLEQLRQNGVTILLVEQNAMRASRFADYSYVLASGQIMLEGARGSLNDEDLVGSYLGGDV